MFDAAPRPTSVLIVDDSRAVRRLVRAELEREGLFDAYLEAADGEEGLRLAEAHRPDLVLCDVVMPVVDGFEFLRRLRARTENAGTFVLMLSGLGETSKKVEGLRLGANDYIVLPCDPAELCARVRNYLRLQQLQNELARKNAELERKNAELATAAITDTLTGLYNRRHFFATATAETTLSPCSALVIDIDHFKRVNDVLGHAQGDAALVAVARVIRRSLRKTNLVARFGGEEFVVWLPETPAPDAAMVGERIRSRVASRVIPGMPWNVTVSVGVSTLDHGETLDALLARADAALYQAKNEGRDRVVSARASSALRLSA